MNVRDFDKINDDDALLAEWVTEANSAHQKVATSFAGATVEDDGGGPYIAFANYGVDGHSGSYPDGPMAFIIGPGDERPGFWQFQLGGTVVVTSDLTIDTPVEDVIAWLVEANAAHPHPSEEAPETSIR